MAYVVETERKPFNVSDYLNEPEVIEAYIGDLQIEIERLHAILDEIRSVIDKAPGHLADTVDPE